MRKNPLLKGYYMNTKALVLALLAGILSTLASPPPANTDGKSNGGSEGQPAQADAANTARQTPDSAPGASASVKAYKTLNFGDEVDAIKQKLTEICGVNAEESPDSGLPLRDLFDTPKDAAAYDYDESELVQKVLANSTTTDPTSVEAIKDVERLKKQGIDEKLLERMKNHDSLKRYFGEHSYPIRIDTVSAGNEAISVRCYVIVPPPEYSDIWDEEANRSIRIERTPEEMRLMQQNSGLAIVSVSYKKFERDKLVSLFLENFPNAKKEGITDKSALPFAGLTLPGIILTTTGNIYRDITVDKRAALSISSGTTCAFTELSKLSKGELVIYDRAAALTGKEVTELYDLLKTQTLAAVKDTPNTANAVFASRKILGFQMSNYRQLLAAKAAKEKAKKKKQEDGATGF
jgi:hypothetical protein